MTYLNFFLAAICLQLNAITQPSYAYGSDNDAPVIGILTLPCSEDTPDCEMEDATFNATTYLPASYVKFIEGGGAKVIPLLSDMKQDIMRQTISQVNGILLTGGDATFSSAHYYWQQILNILSYVREYHSQQETSAIPIWGTCLGLEAMVCETAQAGTNVMTTNISAMFLALPLNFTSTAMNSLLFDSTMDKEYSRDAYHALEENAITFHEHYYGFTPTVFATDAYLVHNFSLLATSVDLNGVEFVSLIESKRDVGLYWFGSQFHPEKPMYEFAKNVPKDFNATYSNQYFAEFFVNECRIRNNNKMENEMFVEKSIYNFDPYYTAMKSDNEYQQMYLFNAWL
eukprot:21342_1